MAFEDTRKFWGNCTQREIVAGDFCDPSGLWCEQKKGGLDTQNQV